MNFTNFLMMHQEAGLITVFLLLLFYDMFGNENSKRYFRFTACLLFGIHTISGFFTPYLGLIPHEIGTAFGGIYVCSDMTILMKNILNIGTLLVLMQSGQWLRSKDIKVREGEFYIIMLATLFGMYMMISAANLMLLYIGIEAASLPLACLVAYNKYQDKSAEAGAKFIMLAALSSGIMLFGISFLYGATGTMYFTDMAELLTYNPMTIMGLVFFFAGLGFKISLVPFHLWTADVYEGAPTGVTAFLSAISKGAAVFALLFALYRVFENVYIVWHHILWVLAVITITLGNLFALRQKDIKRFFAFSSISQAGYIIVGVIAGTPEGMTATVYYVLVYLLANLAVFGVITAVENKSGRTDIVAYNGFYKSNPVLAFVMMLALFSLAGIPPLAGFFSKFFIFAAAAAEGEYVLVFIALVNTVVALYYYLLIIKAMFINQEEEQGLGLIKTDIYNKLTLLFCSAAVLVVGFISCIYEYILGI